jgi:O-antigen/teichoic acid export membrane protein
MSRLKNYASALGSSYIALAAHVVYTLASVPLAFRYLSKPEFALWGLTFQIAGYLALIDFGMASVSRILIDYKDRKDDAAYGSVIQTSVYVSVVQALLIAACGTGLAFVLGSLLRVPSHLEQDFVFLVVGQCVLLAASFVTRIFGFLLAAHQRVDILNYSQALQSLTTFGILWLGFELRQGVFSILWAQLCGFVLTTIISMSGCFRLGLFPRRGRWGQPSWPRFWEIFAFGRDMFFYAIGGQLVTASQTILITRTLGLDSAAIWTVCTRTFALVSMVVYRVFDYSCAALAEMIVRNETQRLSERFKSIVMVSGSLTVWAGFMFALCNQPFVSLWTNGQIRWNPLNDWLLAVWLLLSVLARSHAGVIGLTKDFRFLRFIYFLEGIFFVAAALLVLRAAGITGLIGVSIFASLSFSLPYSIWRTSRYFSVSSRQELGVWMLPVWRLFLLLLPVAGALWLVASRLPALGQFVLNAAVMGIVGGIAFWRWGLDSSLRNELRSRFFSRNP